MCQDLVELVMRGQYGALPLGLASRAGYGAAGNSSNSIVILYIINKLIINTF